MPIKTMLGIFAHCISFNPYRFTCIIAPCFNTEPYESAIRPFRNPEYRSDLVVNEPPTYIDGLCGYMPGPIAGKK